MLEQIRTEINNMLKNDNYYKAYSKESTIKAILIDINNIFDKYSSPEYELKEWYKMKLESGMYSRTKRGQIGKIIHISEYNVAIEFLNKQQDIINQENIKQTRHNMLLLIEVGDVIQKSDNTICTVDNVSLGKGKYILCGTKRVYPNEIKFILPHEQFDSLKYALEIMTNEFNCENQEKTSYQDFQKK